MSGPRPTTRKRTTARSTHRPGAVSLTCRAARVAALLGPRPHTPSPRAARSAARSAPPTATASARARPSGTGIQVAYSCDAALCTTMGIGQTTTRLARPHPHRRPPARGLRRPRPAERPEGDPGPGAGQQLQLLRQPGLRLRPAGRDIDAATQTLIGELNARQEKLGITPQCEINGTLCGKEAVMLRNSRRSPVNQS